MKTAIRMGLIAGLLLGLPPAGVWIAGYDVSAYLEFPPRTHHVEHAPFSWPVFTGLAGIILAVLLPFLIHIGRALLTKAPQTVPRTVPARQFPWWGWLALGLGLVFWVLAWTRFPWFEPLQLYTFAPQWCCYIAVVNALVYRRTGRCMLTHDTKFFWTLFPASAAFWWFFEYLNRFVQNWYYVECEHFTPLQYFIAATLPFSTVLPAVLSTEAWLAGHPRCQAGLDRFLPFRLSRGGAWILLAAAAAGLLLIGVVPNRLYPLLWVAPLLLLVAFHTLAQRPPFFPELEHGDWRRVYRVALAALICGFFWEMWNGHSLAKWIYAVPYVQRFRLFEMPILGYAGYLPFGLECAVIAGIIRRQQKGHI
jgi:hypothetical protein